MILGDGEFLFLKVVLSFTEASKILYLPKWIYDNKKMFISQNQITRWVF
jgi:hypothetical protein